MKPNSFILLHNRILLPFWLKIKTDPLFRMAWYKKLNKLGCVQIASPADCEVALLETFEAELASNQISMMMKFKLQSYYVWVKTTDCLLT
jgi:hypothetical protein